MNKLLAYKTQLNMKSIKFYLTICSVFLFPAFPLFSDHKVPNDFGASDRKDVTSGYYLGFTSLADELRQLRRPSDIPVTDGFIKAFYLDFHYANQ